MQIDRSQITDWLNSMTKWMGHEYKFILIIRDVRTDEFTHVSNDDECEIITSDDIENMMEASTQRKH